MVLSMIGRRLWVWVWLERGLHLNGHHSWTACGEAVSPLWRERSALFSSWPTTKIRGEWHRSLFKLLQFRQTTQSGELFSGFSLHPTPSQDTTPINFQEIGLSPNFSPSHLLMLQAVDRRTVPLCWYSPLQCKLYPPSGMGLPL